MHHRRHRHAVRHALTAAVLAVVLAVSTAPPSPGQAGPALTLDPTSGPAGSAVDARGERFTPGLEAVLRLDDPKQGPVLTDGVTIGRDGTFATAFVVPRGVAPGDHLVHACTRRTATEPPVCDGLPSARFRVSGSSTTTTTTTRPPETTTTSRPPPPPRPSSASMRRR